MQYNRAKYKSKVIDLAPALENSKWKRYYSKAAIPPNR